MTFSIKNYFFDFAVLRTPLFSLDYFALLNDVENYSQYGRNHLSQLQQLVTNDIFQEAIHIASPSFAKRILNWQEDPENPRMVKTEDAIFRYISRMSVRATPFGIFAATSFVNIGQRSNFSLDDCIERKQSRPDLAFLVYISTKLRLNCLKHGDISLVINDTVTRKSKSSEFHYIRSEFSKNKLNYMLNSFTTNEFINPVLAASRTPISASELVTIICNVDKTIHETDAKNFLQELINADILIPDILPDIVGQKSLLSLISKLKKYGISSTNLASDLTKIKKLLQSFDKEKIGKGTRIALDTITKIQSTGYEGKSSQCIQVDMYRDSDNLQISSSLVRKIFQRTDELRPLFLSKNTLLDDFSSRFLKFYGDQPVRLLEAIDDELGIGFTGLSSADESPIANIPRSNHQTQDVGLSEIQRYLIRQITDVNSAVESIEINPSDAPNFNNHSFPDSFHIMGSLIADSVDDIEKKHYAFQLKSVGGPSGVNLMGRFCHGDPRLKKAVEHHMEIEELSKPNSLWAEIAHLPEGRIGNVVARPALRKSLIPILTGINECQDEIIKLSDLYLQIINGQLLLSSRSLGKVVIPRLASAHNFLRPNENLNIYRLLAAMQLQGTGQFEVGFETVVNLLGRIPRITYKELILAPATWKIDRAEVELVNNSRTLNKEIRTLQKLLNAKGVPELVLLNGVDQNLLFDRRNPLAIRAIIRLIRNRSSFFLSESICGLSHSPVSQNGKPFSNEIIIPFVKKQSTPHQSTASGTISQRNYDYQHSSFEPGSRWTYIKIYGGTSSLDRFLTQHLDSLIKQLTSASLVKKWFFIRYADTENHLRLRIESNTSKQAADVSGLLLASLNKLKSLALIKRFHTDRYVPEVSRYGGIDCINLAESFFCYDSELILSLYGCFDEPTMEIRLKLAMLTLDGIYGMFNLDVQARVEMLSEVRESLISNFSKRKNIMQFLSKRFREKGEDLISVLSNKFELPENQVAAREIIIKNNANISEIASTYELAFAKNQVSCTRQHLLISFGHMHVNRLFKSSQKDFELILCDSLERHYRSSIARGKVTPPKIN